MSPPLRSKPHQTALKKALAEGKLQLIGTDHCGWNSMQKAMGRHDFRYRPASIGCQHEHTSDKHCSVCQALPLLPMPVLQSTSFLASDMDHLHSFLESVCR